MLGIPILSATKTSAIYAPTSFTSYFIPANDVIYTIATANTGLVTTDANSIFTLDSLPAQVEVYIGDFDGAGPAAGTILFTTQIGAVLTYTAGTNLKFSSASTAPSTFAACTYQRYPTPTTRRFATSA